MTTQIRIRLILSIAVGLLACLSAGEIPLVFDENKIDVGTMYVYEYSRNKTKYKPLRKEYYYIKSDHLVERVVLPRSLKGLGSLLEYRFNWKYMMLEQTRYFRIGDTVSVFDKLSQHETVKSNSIVDFNKKLRISHTWNKFENALKDYNSNYKMTGFPTYFYFATEDVDLWHALRYFPLEKKEIEVYENHNGFNVKIEIEYIGKEQIVVPYGEVICHKFKVAPSSLFMKLMADDVQIWLTAEDNTMYMVRYENNNARNSFVPRVERRLVDRRQMTLEEWEIFKQGVEE